MSCNPGEGYTLVIAEKAKSAKKIAEALSDNYKTCTKFGVKYWVLNYKGERYVVAPAAGHLFGLDGPPGFPVFETYWKPLWQIDKASYYTKKYVMALEYLASKASKFINACDYDIEGSVIGYTIIKYIGKTTKYYRAKFSSLTKQELVKAFNNLMPPDYEMTNAGLARHEVDWLWGINVSRALMRALELATGKRMILSAGRVQSPLLQHVVDSALRRLTFVPLLKFKIRLKIRFGGQTVKATLEREFENLDEAKDYASSLKGLQIVVVSVKDEEVAIERPPPFNLGDLQAEAGRILRLSPYRTERLAENLYLDGLISYPRTNSQKLPRGLEIREILHSLSNVFGKLVELTNKLNRGNPVPREGEKDDPAHPAIYPTGEKPKGIKGAEFKLYELIVRRFLASVSSDARVLSRSVRLSIPRTGDVIVLNFKKVVFKGWLLIYPYVSVQETKEFLEVKEGDRGIIEEARVELVMSKPPEVYSRIGLLRWMEEVEIGTEATRGRIIETLFTRGYVKLSGGKVMHTPLGFAVSKVLKGYFGHLTSVELTRKLERDLEEIRKGKRTVSEVRSETLEILKGLISVYEKNKESIGRLLAEFLGLNARKKCKLCDLPEYKDGLCEIHYIAKRNLEDALKVWEERGMKREKAISILLKSKSVGKYVKDLMRVMPTDR